MASKWMKGTLALPVIVIVVCGSAISGQTPDGQTPAQEGVCDDLQWATPGLYGLCIAFCEAQDCEPDFSALNPFAECSPASAKLLRNYNRKKQPNDPEMPCVRQEKCPCWTQAELDGFRSPLGDDNVSCLKDGAGFDFNGDPVVVPLPLNQWRIEGDSGGDYFVQVNTFQLGGVSVCSMVNDCAGEGNCLDAFAPLQEIDGEQYAACTAQLRASGAARGLACFQD